MKLQFWSVGKSHDTYVKEGIELFTKRISNYYPVEWKLISSPKNAAGLDENELKKKEGEAIIAALQKDDQLFLLDERGKQPNNHQLAELIQAKADNGAKNII